MSNNARYIFKELSKEQFYELTAIVFCQPTFYKPSVWGHAKRVAEEILIPFNLAYRKDFGRGKGKYSYSRLDLETIKGIGWNNYKEKYGKAK